MNLNRTSGGERGADAVEHVAGVPFVVTTLNVAVTEFLRMAKNSGEVGQTLRFANAHSVVEAQRSPQYMQLLRDEGTNYADGTPVNWYLRRKLQAKGSRAKDIRSIRGPSFFARALDHGREESTRHFFLGTSTSTLQMLSARVHERYPGVLISGMYAPPFGPLDEQFISGCVEEIRKTNSDIVWCALGAPKQDFASTELAKRTGVCTAGVGAAFDFIAETVEEAPEWIQHTGFEWLYRFCREPRRLWRRYLVGGPKFIAYAERDFWGTRRRIQ